MSKTHETRDSLRIETPIPLRRFTVEEYHRMAEAGIFQPNDRVELLEGRIIEMSPKGTGHSAGTTQSAVTFIRQIGDRAIVRIQEPICLSDSSEPEPDLVLARPMEKKYADHHPTPQEVLFVLEVSDTTLQQDRAVKGLLYARAGIPQYGILNLKARELEDYRDPDQQGYRSKQTYRADQQFSLADFPDVWVTIADLLPPE